MLASVMLACTAIVGCRDRVHDPELQWRSVSGKWRYRDGSISVLTYGRGDLSMAGDPAWQNYTLQADLRYDLLFPETHYGDAGVTVRTTEVTPGVDSYRGYYVGLRADDQTLLLGKANYDWKALATVRMPEPIRPGTWFHLSVSVRDCDFHVSANESGSAAVTRLQYTDANCLRSGSIGLRSFYTQSSWRNFHIDLLR